MSENILRTSDYRGTEFPASDNWKEYDNVGWVHESEDDEFHEEYAECDDCHTYSKRDEMHTTHDGRLICGGCYSDSYGTCDETGDTYYQDDLHPVYRTYSTYRRRSAEERVVCTPVRDRDYTFCEGYQQYYSSDNSFVEVRGLNGLYLNQYARDNFHYCECCDTWVDGDDWSGGQDCCENCHEVDEDSGPIHNYHSYEIPKKIGEGPLWYGVEVEVQYDGDCSVKAQSVLDALNSERDRVLCAHDGSIGNGFEIVSAPMSLDEHRKTWDSVRWNQVRSGLSGDNDKCGIHVHVSRAPLTHLQIGRILVFINSPGNNGYVERIARRKSGHYSELKSSKMFRDAKYEGDRYEAVNLTNAATIEFRIFKGNTRSERILAAIEFSAAVVEFCGPCRALTGLDFTQDFIPWVRSNRKAYPYLFARCVELGWLRPLRKKLSSLEPAPVVTQPHNARIESVTTETPELVMPEPATATVTVETTEQI